MWRERTGLALPLFRICLTDNRGKLLACQSDRVNACTQGNQVHAACQFYDSPGAANQTRRSNRIHDRNGTRNFRCSIFRNQAFARTNLKDRYRRMDSIERNTR